MTNAARIFSLSALATGLLLSSGCGPSLKEWSPERTQVGFAPVYHQVPPQPVYNRLRWVNPPSVLPARQEVASNSTPLIIPVFHLDLKNATMEEAAQVLGATARFDSYCSSSIADRKISINRLGTIDELAEEIENSAGITVQVDRESQTVRFLPKLAPQPEFLGETQSDSMTTSKVLNNEVNANEHQSDN